MHASAKRRGEELRETRQQHKMEPRCHVLQARSEVVEVNRPLFSTNGSSAGDWTLWTCLEGVLTWNWQNTQNSSPALWSWAAASAIFWSPWATVHWTAVCPCQPVLRLLSAVKMKTFTGLLLQADYSVNHPSFKNIIYFLWIMCSSL